MNNKYTEAQKQSVLELFANGKSVSEIVTSAGIPRSTIYSWIKASREKKNKKELSLRNFRYLENKVKRLEGIIEILQTVNCQAADSLDIKLNSLEELYGQYNVHMLSRLSKFREVLFTTIFSVTSEIILGMQNAEKKIALLFNEYMMTAIKFSVLKKLLPL